VGWLMQGITKQSAFNMILSSLELCEKSETLTQYLAMHIINMTD
jgi:hypothetical protein